MGIQKYTIFTDFSSPDDTKYDTKQQAIPLDFTAFFSPLVIFMSQEGFFTFFSPFHKASSFRLTFPKGYVII